MYLKELAHITDRALPVIIYALDPAEVEREAVGVYALAGVEIISRQLASGRKHYRRRSGELLRTLDEVCRAVEDNALMTVERVKLAA